MPQNKRLERKLRMIKALTCLAASFVFCGVSAYATPKAAENENSPVTAGADVARPKISAKPTKVQVTGKKRAEAKKTRHDSKSTATTKTTKKTVAKK